MKKLVNKKRNSRFTLGRERFNLSRANRSNSRSGLGIDKLTLARPKRSQQTMGLPFGVIFAIFLIIVFVVIAFLVIKPIIGMGKCADVGLFYSDFQEEVDRAWASQSSDFEYEVELESVERICFANMSLPITNRGDYDAIGGFDYEHNLFLIPPEKACEMSSKLIEHLDVAEITKEKNPYCVDVSRNFRIKKDFYDKLVFVE